MSAAPAVQLAHWVQRKYPYRLLNPVTHLKLQKLCFYGYGVAIALAPDARDEIGEIEFEAWKHGPVNRQVWNEYREYGSQALPLPAEAVRYSAPTSEVLKNILHVYGLLDAWSLRQQSHLEKPWLEAFERQTPISPDSLREHFGKKFATAVIRTPEYLADFGSFVLDGVPTQEFNSFASLAAAVRQAHAL